MLLRRHSRKPTGMAFAVLVMIIAVFFVGGLGIFTMDVIRMTLARQQLMAACDSAAMAAAAALAGSDNHNPVDAQLNATKTALHTLRQNSVLGKPLDQAKIAIGGTPEANSADIIVDFLDPISKQPVNVGDPAGSIIRITGAYGLQPISGEFLQLKKTSISAVATAGVPKLDVVMCFDLSASIDDQTPVTFVKRFLAGPVVDSLVTQGTIYDVLGPDPTGAVVNAVQPQRLSFANAYQHKYTFDAALRGAQNPLDPTAPNEGSLPGLFPGGPDVFTDVVVNIDGQKVFGGYFSNGYDFPNYKVLVEASRGNLENQAVFISSGAVTVLGNLVVPKAGYKDEYMKLAQKQVHPLKEAQDAAMAFYNLFNINTDGHFGFVSFASQAGVNEADTMTLGTVDDGGFPNQSYPLPQVELNPMPGKVNSNFQTIINKIPTTVALGATNIGDSIVQAVNQLKNKSRKGAKKVIVLFTDGQPTAGDPLSGNPWTNARQAALLAHDEGIAIYTVGLAQVPDIIPGETAILNDSDANPATGGVAGIAGNGGKFYLVTDSSKLRQAFERIARHLVKLVH